MQIYLDKTIRIYSHKFANRIYPDKNIRINPLIEFIRIYPDFFYTEKYPDIFAL